MAARHLAQIVPQWKAARWLKVAIAMAVQPQNAVVRARNGKKARTVHGTNNQRSGSLHGWLGGAAGSAGRGLEELTAAGDRAGAQCELAVLATLAERLHQPLYHELVCEWSAQLASTS